MLSYRLFMFIFLLLFLIADNSFSRNNNIDIIQYNIEAKYSGNIIDITALLSIKKGEGVSEINLIFSSDAKIKSIFSSSNKDWIETNYKISNDTIHLILPSLISSSSEVNLEFEYEYPVDDSIKIFYIDRGSRWYPMIIDEVAFVKLAAIVPNEFDFFSAFDLVELKQRGNLSTYIFESKIPVFKIPFILSKKGLYKKISHDLNDKEIKFYSLNTDTVVVSKIINEVLNALVFYDTLIAPYHHNQITLIEMPDLQGSIIGTGIIILGSDFIRQFAQDYFEGLHLSIAAQWFGSGVFGELWDKGFWFFSLSLPHYLRLMFIEHSKGKEIFMNELTVNYDKYKKIAGTEKDFPILAIDMIDTKEKGLAIYGKGPYLLDILRKEMNDTKWLIFLKELYKNYSGKILTYESFLEELSKASSKELESKFKVMITTAGIL